MSAVLTCSVGLPKANLAGLPAVIRTLNRSGAVFSLDVEDLAGHAVEIQDDLEIDLQLPRNETFGPRAMNCVGSVVRISCGRPGKVWLVVRFHSVQFRDLSSEKHGVNSANPRGLLAREKKFVSLDWADFNVPQGKVQ